MLCVKTLACMSIQCTACSFALVFLKVIPHHFLSLEKHYNKWLLFSGTQWPHHTAPSIHIQQAHCFGSHWVGHLHSPSGSDESLCDWTSAPSSITRHIQKQSGTCISSNIAVSWNVKFLQGKSYCRLMLLLQIRDLAIQTSTLLILIVDLVKLRSVSPRICLPRHGPPQ